MQATLEQLAQISVFANLTAPEWVDLQPHTRIQPYAQGEIVMQERDRLPTQLYALLSGALQVTKMALTGKETILRTLTAGEIFAAPALLGDGIAPATVTAVKNSQVLTIERDALLTEIEHNPQIALKIMVVFNQRLQQLHEVVHGLVSERAIVRLARLIQYATLEHGTKNNAAGTCLRVPMPYYQIARSIGITYEECVRLFKQLHEVVSYHRGGKITILDGEGLEAIASGKGDRPPGPRLQTATPSTIKAAIAPR
ncbi:MAG: Crp/Fnr family transcriptional regulator [Acaryochloridaceae cyanobacterium RU_4_10]|nr:Crp/Fnr family transcriptional regulator [Acaryochloridaceae cyanobacterium RU_4_10]